MPRTTALGLVALLALPAPAFAVITPATEFTGEFYEGFERILPPSQGTLFNPIQTFQGHVTYSQPYQPGPPFIITNVFTGFNDGVATEVVAWNGNLFSAITGGTAQFDFDRPMARFGGHFNSIYPANGNIVDVKFFDGLTLVGRANYVPALGEWTWRGWNSSVPFTQIQMHFELFPGSADLPIGQGPPGNPIVFDDLQALSVAGVRIPGDYNGDGTVNAADYTVWADNFGSSNPAADGNGDGAVNAADYTIWADNFGRTTPPGAAVPEPGAALSLAAATGAVLLRRRRR